MKESNKRQSSPELKRKDAKVGLPGEFPPIIIKSGGGSRRGSLIEPTAPLEILPSVPFVMKDHRDQDWRESFTQTWEYHSLQILAGYDSLTFPLSDDNVVMLMLSNGWLKFTSRPNPDGLRSLFIEASDFIFQAKPSDQPDSWRESQTLFPAVITGIQVFPFDAIFTYTSSAGDPKVEFHTPPFTGIK